MPSERRPAAVDGVQLTGQLRGADEVDRGDSVTVDVEERGDDEWLITFSPTD